METLEVHAKDFLVKWVNAPDNCSIVWQVKPLKKSINFAIYRKNESVSPFDDAAYSSDSKPSSQSQDASTTAASRLESLGSSGRLRSPSVTSVNKITELGAYKTKSRSSTFTSNLNNSDLTLVKNYYKLIPGEMVKGTFEIKRGGMYAFTFDNTFSKTISKKIFFSSKILGGSEAPALNRRTSTIGHLHATPDRSLALQELAEDTPQNILRPKNGELMQSVLLKRKRKKLQGFTKRFFILNFKYGTLSYFKNNDNKLRGQMPIVDSIVSVNYKTREIFVDSGMEVWDLKAMNDDDLNAWVKAFNAVKREYVGQSTEPGEDDRTSGQIAGYLIEDVHEQLQNLLAQFSSLSKEQVEFKIQAINSDLASHLSRSKVPNDTASVTSFSEFYDANDYLDANDSGVVIMEHSAQGKKLASEDEADEVGEEDEASSSDSDIESDELPAPSVSVRETAGESDHKHEVDLYPLPLEPIERNFDIPIADHEPPSLLSFVRKNVGKDLSTLSMPVDMNEPVTILQKYSEMLEYSDMIDNALQGSYPEDSCELILRIATFALTYLSGMRKKIRSSRKPFNPLLGETFELVREDKGFRLLCEKVSHKPPVFAMFVESKEWDLSFSPSPSQKFWGKTSEIYTAGVVKLTIRSGEVFTWTLPTLVLKNIIAGEKYTEPSTAMTVKSSSGQRAVVEFAKGGMFSGRSEDVTIKAFSSSKKQSPYSVSGKWTDSMTLKTNSTEKLIWTAGSLLPKSEKKFGFTEFAGSLNKITLIERGQIPPNDSRFRPDMQVYEKGELENAEKLKQELEEGQRQRRKEFEAAGSSHSPLFFEHVGGDLLKPDTGEWHYRTGASSYWERRRKNDWSGVPELW